MNRPAWIYLVIFLVVFCFRLKAKTSFQLPAKAQVRLTSFLTNTPVVSGGEISFFFNGFRIKTSRSFLTESLSYGDRLVIQGQPEAKRVNRFYQQFWLIGPEIKVVPQTKPPLFSFLNWLAKAREEMISLINQSLPEPQASLMAGILLGEKRQMPADFFQALQTTGTLHIIAASGMNLTFFAFPLMNGLALFLKRKLALFISLVCILVYCFLAGASPAVVRAAIMVGLSLMAVFFGREGAGLWSLILTATLMLLVQPLLVFDTGFQLSCSAMAGIICLKPRLQRFCLFRRRTLVKLGDNFWETLSATIATAPVLMLTFGRFSPFSVIPNLFVLPLIPYLMALGGLLIFTAWLYLPLGQLFGWLSWPALTYFVEIINFFGQFDWLNFGSD